MSAVLSYLELTKPRSTALVVFTTGSRLWLAPVQPQVRTVLLTLIGTALVVAAANVLNMYLERDTDALMPRSHGLSTKTGKRWARNEFLASLAYVTVLLAVLVVDHAYLSAQ